MRDERSDECSFCDADQMGMLSESAGVLALDGLAEPNSFADSDSPPPRRFATLRRGILRVRLAEPKLTLRR
jgi:hypothetical protein